MTVKKKAKRGPRGPRGKPGPRGPAGAVTGHLARLAVQLEEVVKELQTQLTRIAQMQSQIDRLASGESPLRIERRKQPRPN